MKSFMLFMSVAVQAGAHAAGNQGLSLPSEVREALRSNGKSLLPLKAVYTIQRTTTLGKKEAEKVGQFFEGSDFWETEKVTLHRDGVKFVLTRDTQRSGDAFVYFYKFNGRDFSAIQNATGAFPTVSVMPLEKLDNRVHCDIEYVDRAGFRRYDKPSPDRSKVLDLIRQKYKITEAKLTDGMFVVELLSDKHRHRFELAPRMGYAVTRYDVLTLKGARIRSTVNSEFTSFTNPSIWLPRKSVSVWNNWPSMGSKRNPKPVFTETLTASELSKDAIPPETFDADIKRSGTIVLDGRLPTDKVDDDFVSYQVPANLDDLDGVIAAAIEGKPYEPGVNWKTRWLIVLNFSVFVVGGCVWWLRKRKMK